MLSTCTEVAALKALVEKEDVTLLFAAREPHMNNAVALAEFLQDQPS
jgi:uncharacterized protein YeaO (DUF488 family)